MKKVLSAVLAASMALSFASVSVFASEDKPLDSAQLNNDWIVADGDGNEADLNGTLSEVLSSSGNNVTIDGIQPDQTVYVRLPGELVAENGAKVASEYVTDKDYFSLSTDKDGDGAKLIGSITGQSNKKIGSSNRGSWMKIEIKDSFTDSDLKAKVELTFKAKSQLNKDHPNTLASGEKIVSNFTLWINNDKEKGDSVDREAGDKFVWEPADNEENTIVWGDDRAALKFDADDDASKFYAKLSTKSMSDIYTEYGDPADADLWFYDFVGNATIPSTSRATLTLGIPWEDDDDYVPNAEDCFIYTVDADGYLTDVTENFTYSEDAEEIEGWSIKTRTLGTFIVSDTELDIESIDVDEPADETTSSDVTSSEATGGKDIPNTGSSDMVNVAVVAAVVSLAAAGAVAFKKVK